MPLMRVAVVIKVDERDLTNLTMLKIFIQRGLLLKVLIDAKHKKVEIHTIYKHCTFFSAQKRMNLKLHAKVCTEHCML